MSGQDASDLGPNRPTLEVLATLRLEFNRLEAAAKVGASDSAARRRKRIELALRELENRAEALVLDAERAVVGGAA